MDLNGDRVLNPRRHFLLPGSVLMPRKRTHPAITKWNVPALRANYSGNAIEYHLAIHLRKIAGKTTGSCGYGEEWKSTYISDITEPEMRACIEEQQSHLAPFTNTSSLRSVFGLEIARKMWDENRKAECVEHLVEHSQILAWMANELQSGAQHLMDLAGNRMEVEAWYESIMETVPPEPPSAERAVHLHISEHAAGGGDDEVFYERLLRSCYWLRRGTTYPTWWYKAFNIDRAAFSYGPMPSCNDWHHLVERTQRNWAYVLAHVLFKAHCLEHFVVPEIHAMLHELNGWRKCAAGLALHERVGKDSALYALGPDVLRMVLRWM